jgi:lactonase
MPNDLVLDAQGRFYLTDFRDTSTDPKGGVYYTAPDLATIKLVLPHLAMANGIALSPDGKALWTTEFGRNLLHRIELADVTTVAPIGSVIAYHFTGPATDSMRAGADGNCMWQSTGKVAYWYSTGTASLIGQVLLPDREQGHNLKSTSMALRPGTNDLYIVTNDGKGGHGATIFHAKTFAKALPPSSPK